MCLFALTSSLKSAFLFLSFPGFREEPKKSPGITCRGFFRWLRLVRAERAGGRAVPGWDDRRRASRGAAGSRGWPCAYWHR
ncbi:hypothetical protein EGJ07_03685 [Stutzerimonas stutzeri]|nr:hypothetical protein EGJ07_03685 [Stutzerimonas stutzeri]